MVLLGYKVGGNSDMTDGEHIGGEKVLYEKGCIVQRKAKKRETFHIYWYYKLTG